MSIVALIPQFEAIPSSTVNGEVNDFTFNIVSSVPIEKDDVLRFKLADGITQAGDSECTVGENIFDMQCNIVGDQITAKILGVRKIEGEAKYSFTVSNLRNPVSTKPTGGYSEIQLVTGEDPISYPIAEFDGEAKGHQNSEAAQIT